MWTFLGLREFMFWVMRFPDLEKSLSDGADEAGMHTQPGEGKYTSEPSTSPKHPPWDCSTWGGPSTFLKIANNKTNGYMLKLLITKLTVKKHVKITYEIKKTKSICKM